MVKRHIRFTNMTSQGIEVKFIKKYRFFYSNERNNKKQQLMRHIYKKERGKKCQYTKYTQMEK